MIAVTILDIHKYVKLEKIKKIYLSILSSKKQLLVLWLCRNSKQEDFIQ